MCPCGNGKCKDFAATPVVACVQMGEASKTRNATTKARRSNCSNGPRLNSGSRDCVNCNHPKNAPNEHGAFMNALMLNGMNGMGSRLDRSVGCRKGMPAWLCEDPVIDPESSGKCRLDSEVLHTHTHTRSLSLFPYLIPAHR